MMCGPVWSADGRIKKIVAAGGEEKDDPVAVRSVEVYDLYTHKWEKG